MPEPRPGQPQPAASARALAAHLVNRVLLDGHSLGTEIDRLRPQIPDPRRMATAQHLAYQTLRHAGRLGFFLDQLSRRTLTPVELTGFLLVAFAELDSEAAPAYAVVNECVAEVGRWHPRARGFVNALLRNFLRQREALTAAVAADPVAHWNFPAWWISRLQTAWPAQWETILSTQNQHPPFTLRINRRRGTLDDYQARLAAAGLAARQTGSSALTLAQAVPVTDLPGFAEGLVSVQDLGAQWAAFMLDVADGLRVLDACAAPGGKTAHLLELADLDLTALDADATRLRRVADNLSRLGLVADLKVADAGVPAGWWDGRPFDRILLDAPCTGTGVVRRHPDGKWLKRAADATDLATQQARLLEALWPLLKPGGTVLYATCSVFPEENSAQIAAFLGRHPDAHRDPLALPDGATDLVADGQVFPTTEHDGFFYARIRKV